MRNALATLALLASVSLTSAQKQTLIYENAFQKLRQMQDHEIPYSFKEAVFVIENAYLDNQLNYDEFSKRVTWLAKLSKSIASRGDLQYDGKDREHMVLASAIYRAIKDTVFIENPNTGDKHIKLPFEYDLDDFWGEQDWSKMFVTKLLYEKTGNCHSLPALYKIVADELKVKSWLALAPNHTYIKQWSDMIGWYNTELTTGRFPRDADIKWNSYIKTEAIADGIYMDTLSVQETIAYLMTDLIQGYNRKFGNSDLVTPIKWLTVALKSYPDFPNALILQAELSKKELEMAMKEKGIEFKEINSDPVLKARFSKVERMYSRIHDIGYRRMPKEMYLNWLFRVQKDTTRTSYKFSAPQPFKKFNYQVPVITAGDGENPEFFDQEDVSQIGTVRYNSKERRIVGFVTYGNSEIPDDIISRMYDPALGRWWQMDPLGEKHFDLTPYNFVNNNPIKYTDPDGRDYGLAINHETRTVTISATYYVQKGDETSTNSARSAAGTWNNQNGGYTYKVGKGENAVEYAVNFDFKVVEVDNPRGEFMNDRSANGDNKLTPDGSSNVYEVLPDNDRSFGSDDHGVTEGGNLVKVKQSDANNTTGAHEDGHTLGLDHSTSGLMTAGQNDSNHSGSPNAWNVQDVIRGALKGNGLGKVTTTGDAPGGFNKGKVKYTGN